MDDSPLLAALRRLQKADHHRQSAKEGLLALWESIAQKEEATAAALWDEVEGAYLAGEMGAILALTARLEGLLRHRG